MVSNDNKSQEPVSLLSTVYLNGSISVNCSMNVNYGTLESLHLLIDGVIVASISDHLREPVVTADYGYWRNVSSNPIHCQNLNTVTIQFNCFYIEHPFC